MLIKFLDGTEREIADLRSADLRRQLEQSIQERDDAEQALSQAYFLVIGHSPEWSNMFGHAEALEDIADACEVLRKVVAKAQS